MSTEDADDTGRAEGGTCVPSSGDKTGKTELKRGFWSRLPWSFLSKQSTKSEPNDDPCRTPEKSSTEDSLSRTPENSPAEEKDEVQDEKQSKLVLQQAVELTTLAVAEDKKRNYLDAYHLYTQALDKFIHALKYETHSKTTRETVRMKCLTYTDRAEKLMRHLQKQRSKEVLGASLSQESEFNENENESIVIEKPTVTCATVPVNPQIKKALQEAVILPFRFPHLFTGQRMILRGILLYGPPGTGKHQLVKAVATDVSNSTMVSVSGPNLESVRSVKKLFNLARENRPSIVFVSMVEVLFGNGEQSMSDNAGEINREFLAQVDTIQTENEASVVIAVTSSPWTLDVAMRTKFGRQVYIPLPDDSARVEIFKQQLEGTRHTLTDSDFKELSLKTENYSASDIELVIRDALMQPIRKLQGATHFRQVSGYTTSAPDTLVDDMLEPCAPDPLLAKEMNWTQVPSDKLVEPAVEMPDLMIALSKQKPSVNGEELKKFQTYTK